MATPKKDPEDFLPDGRPTKYDKSFNKRVYRYALLGLTDKEMSELLDIDVSTFQNWKKDFPKFLDSIRAGKDEADSKVAESTFKRAIGYDYTETQTEDGLIIESGITGSKTKKTKKHVPGDVNAQRLWLMNRRGVNWKDKQEVNATVTVTGYKVGFEETPPVLPKREDDI